ncbi:hypothetical protein J2046_000914 [Rhizobium petrolearium]|nr:hypothetical protein [Neorhizobium petrolearium]
MLSEQAITSTGLFNTRAVAKLHHKCRTQPVSGFRDNAAFVGILSTQLWLKNFSSRATADVPNLAAAAGGRA